MAHWQKTVGGGAFKEGALRGPAQPPSSHANTQRQGATCGVLESKGTFWVQNVPFWVQNVPFESKTKTPRFESYPGNRTKNRSSNRGANAQECCAQCSTTCPPDVCLTLLARARYRFCPLLRCAGHSWPSDQRPGTRLRAARRGSVAAAASVSQKHRSSVAR